MKLIAKNWLNYIEADLEAATILYQSTLKNKKTNWRLWTLIIWHCQQAVEKSLKMIITGQNKELLKIHDLIRLRDYADIKNFPEKWKNELHQLTNYYLPSRYPDMPLKTSYPKLNQRLCDHFLNFAKKFYLWSKKQVSLKRQ